MSTAEKNEAQGSQDFDQTLVLRIRDVIRRLSMEVDFCKGKVLHGDPADNPRGNGQTLQYYHEDTLKDLTSRNWNPDIESWGADATDALIREVIELELPQTTETGSRAGAIAQSYGLPWKNEIFTKLATLGLVSGLTRSRLNRTYWNDEARTEHRASLATQLVSQYAKIVRMASSASVMSGDSKAMQKQVEIMGAALGEFASLLHKHRWEEAFGMSHHPPSVPGSQSR